MIFRKASRDSTSSTCVLTGKKRTTDVFQDRVETTGEMQHLPLLRVFLRVRENIVEAVILVLILILLIE